MLKAIEILPAQAGADPVSSDTDGALFLTHDARHVRRRVLELDDGRRVLIDLPEPTMLNHGDTLVLEDGARVRILAAEEDLLDIRARDAVHLTELAWHIGNRHLAAEIRPDRIRILRDHVIRSMLETLGATVADTRGRFVPVRGAYSGPSGQSHGHSHEHSHQHSHQHQDGHHHGHDQGDAPGQD